MQPAQCQSRNLTYLVMVSVSDLYLNPAVEVVNHLKLHCKALNLDGTSLHPVSSPIEFLQYS